MNVTLPSKYWVYNIPEEVNLESEFGNYNLKISLDENQIIITRVVQFHKGDYTKEAFVEFNEFFRKLEKLEKKKLVLNDKT